MTVYKTKASLTIKLLFSILLLIAFAIALVEKRLALVAVIIVFCAVTIYIFYNTYYTIYENQLTIKSGFLYTEWIDINTIKKVTRRKRHLLSGPGFSVDRLIIEYNDHDCVIISPSLQQAFVAHLQRINAEIKYFEETP